MKRNQRMTLAGWTAAAALILILAGCGSRDDSLTKVPPVSAHPQVPIVNTSKPAFHKLPPLGAKGIKPGDVPM